MNLRLMMGCLWHTRFLPMIMSINDKGEVCVCIEGSHAVHADSKGHSGLFVSMRRGAMSKVSKNLGVVTVSLTETEVASNR